MTLKLCAIATLVIIATYICTGCTHKLSTVEQVSMKQAACEYLNAMRKHDVPVMKHLLYPHAKELKMLQQLEDSGKSHRYINRWLFMLGVQDTVPIKLDTLRINMEGQEPLIRSLAEFYINPTKSDKVEIPVSDMILVEYTYQVGRLPAIMLMAKYNTRWLVSSMPGCTTALYKYKNLDEAYRANDEAVITSYKYSSTQQKAKMLQRCK